MRHFFILSIMFILSTALVLGQQIPYVSPGIEISWDLEGNFIISPKISFGLSQDGTFYNLTVGRSSSTDQTVYPHYYIEAQAGVLSKPLEYRRMQLFYGGGIGAIIPTSPNEKFFSLRFSAFTGNLLFIDATFLVIDTIQPDLGVQLVLPIPLKRIHFGSIGG